MGLRLGSASLEINATGWTAPPGRPIRQRKAADRTMTSTLDLGPFGAALRARRTSLGLTQVQTCDLAGVGPAFLYALEHGKPTVRLDKVLAVLAVLGLGLELGERGVALSIPTREGGAA